MKPGDLASGARRTEKWYKETHVTTIKREGGARKNTRAHESEEHTRARKVGLLFFVFVFLFLGGWVGLEDGHIHAGVDRLFEWLEAGLGLQVGEDRGVEEGGEKGEKAPRVF